LKDYGFGLQFQQLSKGRCDVKQATVLFMVLAVAAEGCGDGNGDRDDADAVDVPVDRDAADEVTSDGDVPAEDMTAEDLRVDDGPIEDPIDIPAEEAVDLPDAIPDTPDDLDPEEACLASGGEVDTMECCMAVNDFPNLCLEGPCGCAPEYSHEIRVCVCGTGECFNGTTCVPF